MPLRRRSAAALPLILFASACVLLVGSRVLPQLRWERAWSSRARPVGPHGRLQPHASWQRAGESTDYGEVDSLSSKPGLDIMPRPPRVAIVNAERFHLEVVAGLVEAVSSFANTTDVFLHQDVFIEGSMGFLEWMSGTECTMQPLPLEHLQVAAMRPSQTAVESHGSSRDLQWSEHVSRPFPGNVFLESGDSESLARQPMKHVQVSQPEYNYDLMVLVSPEWNISLARSLITWGRPAHVVVMVHNGNTDQLPMLMALHPNLQVATLGPHVARFVSRRIDSHVEWILPTRSITPAWKCKPRAQDDAELREVHEANSGILHTADTPWSRSEHMIDPTIARRRLRAFRSATLQQPFTGKGVPAAASGADIHQGLERQTQLLRQKAHLPCLSGFAIQGTLDPRRRNYLELWAELRQLLQQHHSKAKQDHRFMLQLIGNGPAAMLSLPHHLRAFVEIRSGLSFLDFYEAIHHTLALLPAFASGVYYDRKFSSTVITSLVSSTPIIADHDLLRAYWFLNRTTVYLRRRGEAQADVITRLLTAHPDDVYAPRAALGQLQQELNTNAKTILTRWASQAVRAADTFKT